MPLGSPSFGGTSQSFCRINKQYLSARTVPISGRKVCRPSAIPQASSAVGRETEKTSDDSLEAAVKAIEFTGVHHVGLLCESVEKSLEFYCGLLGLEINPNRPNDKLPYGGVWLNVGSPSQMIHLMELPNPDPKEGRPKHGGRDRHACVSVKDVMKIKEVFDRAGVTYTFSQSGRPALFARDPDGNALEFSQM
jgi:catechol 2,3-dioxygenase-like lactoylglutathione lyase family enzyme